ncbi:MAG: 3,4-dihydroxy-2-butanone-4-phosphate synthase [Alphaproteobacteria bacterium]
MESRQLQEEPWRLTFRQLKSPTEELIEEARNGRMFILVDSENRENEGDLIVPAQMATPAAINFMATNGRGLICLALTEKRIEELRLPLMSRHNASRHQTAFTVSIEAREGISTGISAPDRARTVAVAINPAHGPDDISTPGHIFPLSARDGGVLTRMGHTEAGVDIARLAGLNPSAVICEIMNEDGTMARRNDLIAFAQRHGLKIGTIEDLIAYRLRHDRIVQRIAEADIKTLWGGQFRLAVYANSVHYAEHVALIKGDISTSEPVLVRMHALSPMDDLFGAIRDTGAGHLQSAMQMIDHAGRGVLVLLREPVPTALSDLIRRGLTLPAHGERSDKMGRELREYGVGAQILLDLGIKDLVLLTNSQRTIVALDGWGIRVVERRPLPSLKV